MLVFADRTLFDSFGFDPEAVRRLTDEQGWAATVTILHRIADGDFEARNLFPVGAITEDPATGAAAAAVGAYLRILGLVEPPSRVLIHQGRHVGRPGLLTVDIPATGGIVVSGTAVRIPSHRTTANPSRGRGINDKHHTGSAHALTKSVVPAMHHRTNETRSKSPARRLQTLSVAPTQDYDFAY